MPRAPSPIIPRLCAALLLVLPAGLTGCSGSAGPTLAAVKGEVTLDGQPLAQGRILFEPAPGNTGPVAGASIINGRYDIPADKGVAAGKQIVRINANKKTGKQVPGMSGEPIDELVEAIPPQYNAQSTLEREISPPAADLNFELSSK